MWQPLIFTLLFIPLVRNEPHSWGKSCPTACTCYLTLFKDLSLHRWLKQRKGSEDPARPSPPPKQNNEAFYEEDIYPPGETSDYENMILKMAMCVLQSETDLNELFNKIPSDVQVLSLLQGSDSGNINLEFQHTHGLQNLIVLEVLGYDKSDDTKFHSRVRRHNEKTHGAGGEIILHDDVMKHLSSLQYVNLQNVKLRGRVENNAPQSELLPNSVYDIDLNKIPDSYTLGNPNEQYFGMNGNVDKNFVSFVPVDTNDNVILPYGEYVKQQHNAGFSVFAGLSQLVFLRIVNCGLHKVNWEMFEGLSSLEYLSLERNHLLFLPEFAFHGTPNLKMLSLARNKLLNLHSTCLAGLLELEKLDLSHNNFSHLSELSLPPFPKLHTANFKHNPLEAIFASTFEIMNATTILYVGGDGSALDIKPNSFVGLQALKKLNIYNAGIPLMERELLKGMPKLTDLEITGTMNALSYDAFLEVPKLERLILTNCHLKTISMDAFYGLYALLHLDLSNNLLESLPPNLFDQQTSLKELLLNNNHLTELPVGFFRNIPAKMIRLDGNPWHCSCAMSDWQPTAINKVKLRVTKFCDIHYDKGSMCKRESDEYVYNKKVVPRCSTPKKYRNWSVFHTIRKELRCAFLRKHSKAYKKILIKKHNSGKVLNKQKYESRTEVQHHVKNGMSATVMGQPQKPPSHNQNEQGQENANVSLKMNASKEISANDNNINLSDMPSESERKTEYIKHTVTNDQQQKSIRNVTELPPAYVTAAIRMETDVTKSVGNYGQARKFAPTTNKKSGDTDEEIIQQSNKHLVGDKAYREQHESNTLKLLGISHNDSHMEMPQQSVNIYNSNGEISKKAWKLELKRKHEEKLKKYAHLLRSI